MIRPIAIYLPQFHPIPENDAWWGKGFTEWRNVVKARPRYKGHYQPHLPADLGFYDLRLPEVRQAQADLARAHGVYGFCYYHYWFNGRRLLERPFEEVFRSGEPDFPFMLCWANENWTRVWDGGEQHVLMQQAHTEADDVLHIRSLLPYFRDPRYIKVEGKPVFVIYKDTLFPDISNTLRIFRREAEKEGLELYLCRFDRDVGTLEAPPEALGFDAAIEFQPLSRSLTYYRRALSDAANRSFIKYLQPEKYIHYAYDHYLKDFSPIEKKYLLPSNYLHYAYNKVINPLLPAGMRVLEKDLEINMEDFVAFDCAFPQPAYKLFPGVSPSWDNSARRAPGKATIFTKSNPALFQRWTEHKLKNYPIYGKDENFLFINAWNEWAEGNHLEPDEKWGHAYLEALRDALQSI